jgi:sec-independent protein translocase protein TatA
MFNFGFGELMVILILALIIFGPGKLPQVGAALGKGISEFKKAARDLQDDLTKEDKSPKA